MSENLWEWVSFKDSDFKDWKLIVPPWITPFKIRHINKTTDKIPDKVTGILKSSLDVKKRPWLNY